MLTYPLDNTVDEKVHRGASNVRSGAIFPAPNYPATSRGSSGTPRRAIFGSSPCFPLPPPCSCSLSLKEIEVAPFADSAVTYGRKIRLALLLVFHGFRGDLTPENGSSGESPEIRGNRKTSQQVVRGGTTQQYTFNRDRDDGDEFVCSLKSTSTESRMV